MLRKTVIVGVLAGFATFGAACWMMDATPSEPSGTEDAGESSSRTVAEPKPSEAGPAAAASLATLRAKTDANKADTASAGGTPPSATVAAAASDSPEPAKKTDEAESAGDDDDDTVWVGPPDHIDDCEGKLDAAGVVYSASRIPLRETKGGYMCGAEQAIRYETGPGAIRWGGRPRVTCGVGLAMAKLETIVQEEAERHFGRKVKRIVHMGTYNCREMANYPGWVSEHSYGNAIDIKEFQLQGGRTVSVLADYAKAGTEAKSAKAKFLRTVARRLYDERVFAVVLTPSFDRAHRNHFHLDMARYNVDGI